MQIICTPDSPEPLEIANSTLRAPQEWFLEWGGWTSAGRTVANGHTTLTWCPLWQGVNIIAGDIGQLPVRLMRRQFEEQRDHPAWKLLRVRPNRLQTPRVWKETMMQWALVWGNAVSLIIRQGARPVELIPLRPDRVWVEISESATSPIVVYHYHSPSTGQHYRFLPDDVLHLRGLTVDGIWGWPLWIIARRTVEYGLSLEQHGASVFANGAIPAGVLEAPKEAIGISKDPEARRNLRDEWNRLHRGPDRAGSIAILWEGITFKQTTSTNVDAQWVEAKRMGVYEAAALLNLPPHKLGALEDSSVRANLEEQNVQYLQHTLARWLNALDEEYRAKLLTFQELQSDEYHFVHDTEAFLRGDLDTLTTVADRCVKAELMNRNEARAMIGLPPYEGGEVFGSPAINPRRERAENRLRAARRAIRQLLEERVAHVLECEQSRAVHAAHESRHFAAWVDEFFAADGRGKLLALARRALSGAPRAARLVGRDVATILERVREHASSQHRALRACANATSRADLVAAVERHYAARRASAAQFLRRERRLGDADCEKRRLGAA